MTKDPARGSACAQDLEALYHELRSLPHDCAEARLNALPDPQVRSQLQALLRASPPPNFEQGWTERFAELCDDVPDPMPATVGRYQLQQILGEGGMSHVYLARLIEDGLAVEYAPHVALKILKREACTPDLLQKFARERTLLLKLIHPGIARIIEGGQHSDGRPYYAMEYVDGVAIDTYCSEQALNLSERLALLIQLCHAVGKAHALGIVHRDVKPANVMVDVHGQVKLLDFGFAKVADAGENRPRTAIQWMTPDYASPEQRLGAEVDARSDVFSLGVVSFELLTGRRAPPPSPRRAKHDGPCSDARFDFRQLRAGLFELAGGVHGRLRARALWKLLARTLSESPERRPRSATELAEAFTQLLEAGPWRVRIAGPWLPAWSPAGSNPRNWAMLGLLLGLLATGLALLDRVQEAQSARERAELQRAASLELATLALRERSWEGRSQAQLDRGQLAALTENFDRLWASSLSDPTLAPEALARFALLGVELHRRAGAYSHAEAIFNSTETRLNTTAWPTPTRIEWALERGRNAVSLERYTDAESIYKGAAKRAFAELGQGHVLHNRARYGIALARHGEGSYRDQSAAQLLDRVLRDQQQNPGTPPQDRLAAVQLAADIAMAQSNYAGARDYIEQATELANKVYGHDAPQSLALVQELATIAANLGDYSSAIMGYRNVAEVYAQRLGVDHPDTATARYCLGKALGYAGRYTQALHWHQQARDARLARLGPTSKAYSASLHAVAELQATLGNFETALAGHRHAIEIRDGIDVNDTLSVGDGYYKYGTSLYLAGHTHAAASALKSALRIHRTQLPNAHPLLARVHISIADAELAQGDLQLAHAHATAAHAIYRERFGEPHWRTADAAAKVAVIELKSDPSATRQPAAVTDLGRATAALAASLGPEHPRVLAYRVTLRQSHATTGYANGSGYHRACIDGLSSRPASHVPPSRCHGQHCPPD